jgi:hypothetical protein
MGSIRLLGMGLVVLCAWLGVVTATASADEVTTPLDASLGDPIFVPIDVPCPTPTDIGKSQLIVNGMQLGLMAQGCHAAVDGKKATMQFILTGVDQEQLENSGAWHTLIGLPFTGKGSVFDREVEVGVAIGSANVAPTGFATLHFLWPIWRFWTATIVVVGIGVILVALGIRTALLRDVGVTTAVPARQRTFSLARTQMAWWTFVIAASYVYRWMTRDTIPALNGQALALMGVYSVLAVVSRGVDLSRGTSFPPVTPHFLNDLISDESGVAIHRLQMLIFTVIVGLVFLHTVITTGTMPVIEPYTLTLIGISGATYIGFKSTEPQPKAEEGSGDGTSDAAKSGYSTGSAPP